MGLLNRYYYYFYFQSESPSGSDLNALGVYLLCSLVFVVGALIEFAVVILLNRTQLTLRKNVRSATKTKRDTDVNAKLRRRIRRMHAVRKFTIKQNSDIKAFNDDVDDQAKQNCMFSIPPIYTVDIAAFWVFFFSYLLFICTYWIQYSRA